MKKFTLLVMFLLASVFAFAQPASYLNFNGTDQYMMIPNHDDFNITTSESFTMTGWVKITNYGSNSPRYISKRENKNSASGDARTGYELFGLNAANSLGLNTPTNTSGHAYTTYTGVTVNTNTWMHFALVVDHDNDVIRIYQSGSNVASSATGSSVVNNWYVNNTNNVYIGAGYNNGNVQYLLNGSMGNVRFYSKALSSSEVSTDMNNSALASLTQDMRDNLIAAYEMSENNIYSGHISDLSGKGHTATMVGFASSNSITLMQNTQFTGRGNPQDVILKALVNNGSATTLQSAKVNLNGTTSLSDVTKVKIYSTGTTNFFDSHTAAGATLLGEYTPTSTSSDFDVPLSGNLPAGTSHLWVTATVANNAVEGHHIDASLKSITTAAGTINADNASPDGSREILLARTTLFRPGDYSSKYYRIPAVITAKDGSIVAITDKRKNSNDDLPQDIDIVARRSTDGGHTWSEPVTIAQGKGYKQGYGDCAIAWGKNANELIAVFVGGNGISASTPSDRIKTYVSKSTDNGQSWSTPTDISNVIYNGTGYYASFCGSGNGLLTTSGRIMFVAAIRESSGSTLYNRVLYSDDNGVTWNLSERASTDGDEAKVTQLNDGRILMSIRHKDHRLYNISSDNGETWGSTQFWYDLYNDDACNGDMIRYTSLSQGYEKNRLLHSFPDYNNGRRNVSVFVSYDEGTSWPTKKCIVPYSSAYSSLCILPDGTIGLYVEEDVDGSDTYDMVFYNFSLSWMTGGNDVFVPLQPLSGILSTQTYSGNYYIDGNTTIPNGVVATFTGNLTGTSTSNFTIEDGGQLVYDGIVHATVHKNITGSPSWGIGSTSDGWYTISSPIRNNALSINDIVNFTNADYDLYYYDEAAHIWRNSKDDINGFSTLTNTRGYLYAAISDRTLAFSGELNNADINYSLSYTKSLDVPELSGFNLIGNPFPQNITMDNISGISLPGGYVLTNAGAWKAEVDTEIKPCEGFLVQTDKAVDITISKNTSKSHDRHCYIAASVNNSEYEDNAFAMFSETTSLNKITHRNGNLPMLYIPQNDAEYAIAVMDESVTLFPLNFKAMTTGYYTISLKSSQIYEGQNDFDYLQLIDNMTGEKIDMLLEESYLFVGSPCDNKNRFTVKLHRNGAEENDVENENFVYQNGNNLIINGEGTFQLIDILGRMLISKEIHDETISFDNLITGTYIVRMIGNEVKTQRIVIR